MKLLVGLGNPGPRYDATRHNLGARVIDALGLAQHIGLRGYLPMAQYGEGTVGAHQVVLAKPLTYMNASGQAVACLCSKFSITPEDVIVIHDDLDLQLGRIKLKTRGGDAGHYGVRSIKEHLGTGDFTRFRMGIGRPASKDAIVSYVLDAFTPDELPLVEEAVHNAVEKLESLLRSP